MGLGVRKEMGGCFICSWISEMGWGGGEGEGRCDRGGLAS